MQISFFRRQSYRQWKRVQRSGRTTSALFQRSIFNGPTWAEEYAGQVGASAVAFTNGGTNYAFGGARTGSTNFPFNLVNQTEIFVANGGVGSLSDLFVVWAGSNDIFDAAASVDPAGIIASAVFNIGSSIETLQATGAEYFLVLNSAPLGQTPFYQPYGAATISYVNSLSASFNQGLASKLSTLESDLGIDILEVDMYSFFEEVQANQGAFGLSNATDSSTPFDAATSLSSGLPTVDPETYLFWDGIHPTAAGHRLIANRVFVASVPEPSAIALLATFCVFLCLRRKRHGVIAVQ